MVQARLHPRREQQLLLGPCASSRPAPGATPVAAAAHLADDRHREPSFEDLLAGNDREPSHQDLLADDDEFPDAIRDTFKAAYTGAGGDAIAWLRAQDTEPTPPAAPAAAPVLPADHDEHAFDVDRLVPADLRVVDPTQLDKAPTVPAGNPRLLFDALDALDRLPALFAADEDGYQLAANMAAVQTYSALRPELPHAHEVRALLALIAEQLDERPPLTFDYQLLAASAADLAHRNLSRSEAEAAASIKTATAELAESTATVKAEVSL